MFLIDVCHPNEIILNRWTQIDSFSDFDDLDNHIQHPSFNTSVGLCVRVTDESTQHIVYAGIYGEHRCTAVHMGSSLMECAIQRVPDDRGYFQDLFDFWNNTLSYNSMTGILLETLSSSEIVDIYLEDCEYVRDSLSFEATTMVQIMSAIRQKVSRDELREKTRYLRQVIIQNQPRNARQGIEHQFAHSISHLSNAYMVIGSECEIDMFDDEIIHCKDCLLSCVTQHAVWSELDSERLLSNRLRSRIPFLRIALGIANRCYTSRYVLREDLSSERDFEEPMEDG